MGDYKFYGGGAWGAASVRQNSELTPYGTDYRRTELHFGVENTTYFPVIPFVPASWARGTLLVDASFEDTAGGQINWGSKRMAAFLRAGVRFRLTPLGVLVGDVKFGAGGASNNLNFGKGINPPHEYSINIQGQAAVGAMFCLNADYCLGPIVGASVDHAFSTGRDYSSGHFFVGFRIEGKINPDGDKSNEDKIRERETVLEKQCVNRETVLYNEKERWRTRYEEEKKQKCPARDAEPSPPLDKAPQVRPPETIVRNIKELEYRWLRELPTGIHFQNDKWDLLPLPQQFPACGKKCGEGNPTLNLVIFGAWRWVNSVIQADSGGKPAYKMAISLQGLANDTGSPERNFMLATNRSAMVINYLTGKDAGTYKRRNYEGQVVPLIVGETMVGPKGNQMRLGDMISITQKEIYADPTDNIIEIMTGKKRSDLIESEREQLADKVNGEEWRKVIITYQISKLEGGKYHNITVDQFIQERLQGMVQEGGK